MNRSRMDSAEAICSWRMYLHYLTLARDYRRLNLRPVARTYYAAAMVYRQAALAAVERAINEQ